MASDVETVELDMQCAWMLRDEISPGAKQRLEERFAALAQSLRPTPDDHRVRQDAVDRLNTALAELFPAPSDVRLVPFGSFRSGCFSRGSDLDLALTGRIKADWQDPPHFVREDGTVDLSGAPKERCARVLRMLALQLVGRRLVEGKVKCVLGDGSYVPRVPVISFKEASTGISCDVSVNTRFSDFKSSLMALLHRHQPLLTPFVQLVKLWARTQGINCASQRTFNSWTLELMCVWCLQFHPSGGLLPPLWELFLGEGEDPGRLQCGGVRPLQGAKVTREELDSKLRSAEARLRQREEAEAKGAAEGRRAVEEPSLLELLWWFLHCGALITKGWLLCSGPAKPCPSTWLGRICSCSGRFDWSCRGAVEDPFDFTDNTARTLGKERSSAWLHDDYDSPLPDIIKAFCISLEALEDTIDEEDADRVMEDLFGQLATKAAAAAAGGGGSDGDGSGSAPAAAGSSSPSTRPVSGLNPAAGAASAAAATAGGAVDATSGTVECSGSAAVDGPAGALGSGTPQPSAGSKGFKSAAVAIRVSSYLKPVKVRLRPAAGRSGGAKVA